MEHCFGAMLCSNLGNENSDVDHIKCSRGPQVPHPWSTPLTLSYLTLCGTRADPGGDCPPKTYENIFFHHDFVQFGKQHSRYKARLDVHCFVTAVL